MKRLFLILFGFIARIIVAVKRPTIVWVTGTVGKSTITQWIGVLLQKEYGENEVMFSKYNYNGEFGLPLTIFWAKSPWNNPFKWIAVFCIALSRFFRPYPRFLVLEYGIDHPWEMDFLLSIAVPDIGILTEVTPNHIENFASYDEYLWAKLLLIERCTNAIVYENMRDSIGRDALYYGLGALSSVDASSIREFPDHTDFSLHIEEEDISVSLPLPGSFQILNVLPLFCVAKVLGIPTENVSAILPSLDVWNGRGKLLTWVGNSIIIDGSYNAGYRALSTGIAFLGKFIHDFETVLFIWDMRELGETYTETFHTNIAHEILHITENGTWYSKIALVGENMKHYVLPLLQGTYWDRIAHFSNSKKAWVWIHHFLDERHEKTPVIYVKGSQNTIFLEEGIKEFLLNKADIIKLCRQSDEWLEKKWINK